MELKEPVLKEISDNETIECEDYIFKIVIVGDSGVGKSNIMTRYTINQFQYETKSTVGVELQSKLYNLDGKIIKIQLWDTAGQERYKSITSAYFKGAKGAMIVYDLTRMESFESLDRWYQQVVEYGDNDIVVIQVGNKSDLNSNRQVDKEVALEKARLKGKQAIVLIY